MNRFLNKTPLNGGYFSKFTNPSFNTILIGIVVFILVSLASFYYFKTVAKNKTIYNANNENSQGNATKQAEMMLFYADWCPHCKTAKPIWEEIEKQYKNKTINGYNIIFTEINCSTETSEVERMMNKYNIEGFPTIKLLKDGQIIEFDAKPTKDTLNQFINTVL
jgi:thiol-disulfide isomerase/thioredoxin